MNDDPISLEIRLDAPQAEAIGIRDASHRTSNNQALWLTSEFVQSR
jgi:hypothetical protein